MQDILSPALGRPSNVFRHGQNQLAFVLSPKTVAVLESSDKDSSLGKAVLRNLIGSSFSGTVYPISEKRPSLLGIRAYPRLAAVPERIELVILSVPAADLPARISECADSGVKAAIVMREDFIEAGPLDIEQEFHILELAAKGRMPIIGLNSAGVMNPRLGLNATYFRKMAHAGNVGFISQSEALSAAILDWSVQENVGFSAFISSGSMLDVGWGELIGYLGDDPYTRSILVYMESIGDAAAFISAAREVALTKPIIVMKPGRPAGHAQAAASHAAALTGSDEALDAAFRRCGVLRVSSLAELFYMAETLSKQPRPKGRRLAIITNAGGPGVLAADALIDQGGELAAFSPEVLAALDAFLPSNWSHGNPVDLLDDADPERFAKAIQATAADPNCDGVLVILAPQRTTDATRTANLVKEYAKLEGKPILASWMGGAEVNEGVAILNRANIPTFPYPDTAARTFHTMWRYSYNLNGLYEIPKSRDEDSATGGRAAAQAALLDRHRHAGEQFLDYPEAAHLLEAYGIPVAHGRVARTAEEAVTEAGQLGYPVALKVNSTSGVHKARMGAVRLDLWHEQAVREAFERISVNVASQLGGDGSCGVIVQKMMSGIDYELILGSSQDDDFGPVLLFGAGGSLVEVFRDRALGLPPLNSTLARRMMERTRIYRAMTEDPEGKEADPALLEQILVRFSLLVAEQRQIQEIEINPLAISGDKILALDMRVQLHDPDTEISRLPHPAIRPYPTEYVWNSELKDGTSITVRPIRPEDEPLMIKFHEGLSDRSIYYRYFHMMKLSQRIAHDRLRRICFIDYNREMALVADRKDTQSGEHRIIGVGRLTKARGINEAEFAVLISDAFQGRGLGTLLLQKLIEIARNEKLTRIVAEILHENTEMQYVIEKLGFRLQSVVPGQLMKAELTL